MSAIKNTILPILALISLAFRCGEPCPDPEPNLSLSLASTVPFRVDTLYGIGATGTLPHFTTIKQAAAPQFQTALPLSLRADSTRYVISLNGKNEVITVYYKRHFYAGGRCSMVVNLLPPDAGKKALTTTGTIKQVKYDSTGWASRYDNGIWLTIAL